MGKRVTVRLRERTSYQIEIGTGLLGHLGQRVREAAPGGKVVVVTTTKVGRLYGEAAMGSLKKARLDSRLLVVPDGERSKSLRRAAALYDELVAAGSDRDTVLVALGGGVVGDLTGFVASTFLRGLRYVQVPTTLLAQVDSSVGGKTGVNLKQAKNIIGSFYQPSLVLADTGTLETLPRRQLASGVAEVIKCGLIGESGLLEKVRSSLPDLLQGAGGRLEEVIGGCIGLKARIVQEDQKDRGIRAVLNYGHTIGHAIEAASGFRTYLHGEALGIGMFGAAVIASRLKLLTREEVAVHSSLCDEAGLPTTYHGLDPRLVYERLLADKKRRRGRHQFVLLRGPGKPAVVTVADSLVRSVIRRLAQTGSA